MSRLLSATLRALIASLSLLQVVMKITLEHRQKLQELMMWTTDWREALQVVAVATSVALAAVAIRWIAEPVLVLDNSTIFAICGVFLCISGSLMRVALPGSSHHPEDDAAVPAPRVDDRAAPRLHKAVEKEPNEHFRSHRGNDGKTDAKNTTNEKKGSRWKIDGENQGECDGLIANSAFAAGFWTLLTGSIGGTSNETGGSSSNKLAAAAATRDILKSIDRWDRNSAANIGSIRHLLQYNIRWAAAVKAANPGYFEELAEQQTPKYMWIGCSDSRVPANQIVGLAPGEVFVHRNVGNVVSRCDLNCLSVLQYAVDVLKVEHVIVCGHFKCGGVTAAHNNHRCGLVDTWIMNVVDVKQRFDFALQKIPAEHHLTALHDLNVIRQVGNAADTHSMQDHWKKERAGDPAMQPLRVHGLMYNLKDGLLHELITLNVHSNVTSVMYEAVDRVVRHYNAK